MATLIPALAAAGSLVAMDWSARPARECTRLAESKRAKATRPQTTAACVAPLIAWPPISSGFVTVTPYCPPVNRSCA